MERTDKSNQSHHDNGINGQKMNCEHERKPSEVNGAEDLGSGIARVMFGNCVFRGTITKVRICSVTCYDNRVNCFHYLNMSWKYRNTGNNEGTYYGKYTDGTMLKMNAAQAMHARIVFEEEVAKLVEVGVPKADAANLEYQTVTAMTKKHIVRQPLLEEGDEDPEHYEQLFEEVYQGDIPHDIVGIQFKEGSDGNLRPRWERILM